MQTNVIRRISIEATQKGVAEATAGLKGLANAQNGIVASSEKQTKAQISVASAYERQQRSLDVNYRSSQQFEKAQRTLDQALQQGIVTSTRHGELSALNAVRYGQQTNAAKALGTASTELNSRMQAAAGSFGVVGSALATLGPAGLAAGAALGVVAIGFKQAADAALALADRAGKLKDFSETTGFTVVQLQALQKAGEQVGVSSESVNRGLERFSVAMDDIKKGTGAAYESILEINPALAEQMKGVNSLTDAWDIFSQAVKSADLEQANKLARSVFGRSGVEITRLARANADAGGLSGVVKELKEVDRITAAQAERWDTLGDTIASNMKLASQNVASIFADPVLNALNAFSSGFLSLSGVAKSFTVSEDMRWWLGKLAAVLTPTAIMALGSLTRIMGAGTEAAPANDNTLSFNDRYANAPTGQAGSLDTVRLDAQKRAMSVAIADQERWNAAMGAAVTPAANLKLAIDKIKLAALENKISTEQAATAQGVLNAQYKSSQFSTYIGLLGQAAPVEEQVQAKRNQINDAARQGVNLTKDQIANQLRLTQSQALGTFQIDAATAAEKLRIDTLLMSNQAGIAYAIVQTKINEAKAKGAPLSAQEIADLQKSADAYAGVKVQADRYEETIRGVSQATSQFADSFVQSFIRSGDAVQALIGSLGSLGSSLTSIGSRSVTSSLETALKGGGLAFDPVSLGIGAAGIGISLISSLLGNDSENKKKMEEAKARWAGMADQVTAFNNAAAGFNLGPMTQAIQSLFQQQLALAEAAYDAEDYAGLARVQETFNSGVRRIVGEFVNATAAMTPLEESIKAVNDEARGLEETLRTYNLGSDPGIELSRLRQIAELQAEFFRTTEEGLRADINSAKGVGYVNEIADALKKFNDLAAQGVNGGLLQDWLSTIAQDVIDNAGLMGDAFDSLIAGFPQLIGMVHEASDVIKELRSAQDLARGSESLVDRLFRATVDGDTLAGQLALFERAAMRERENEIRSGGELLTDLIAAQEAERFNLVRDFNQKAIDEQRNAAKEFADFLSGLSRNIREFIDGFQGGSNTNLSPFARRNAALSSTQTQYGLALGGDRDALGGITQYVQTLIEAQRAYGGSSSETQALINEWLTNLEALPGQVSSEQYIVDAIDVMRTTLLAAIQSNSPAAIGAALSGYFNQLDTNLDDNITFSEMVSALGASFSSGTWANILSTLDTDGDGQINRLEVIKGNTNSTVTKIDTTNTQLQQLQQIIVNTNGLYTVLSTINGNAGSIATTSGQSISYLNLISNTLGLIYDSTQAMRFMMRYQNNAWGITYINPLPQYAMGTNFAQGGMSIVGERGPEIMNVPRGAQIIPNHRINFSNDNRQVVTAIEYLTSEVQRLRAENTRAQIAAAEYVGGKVDGVSDAIDDSARDAKILAA